MLVIILRTRCETKGAPAYLWGALAGDGVSDLRLSSHCVGDQPAVLRIHLPAVLQFPLETIPMRKAFLLQPSKAMQARMDTAHVPSATALARQCLLGKKLHHASQRRPHLQLLPPTQLHTCTASVMRWPPLLSAVPFLATIAAS